MVELKVKGINYKEHLKKHQDVMSMNYLNYHIKMDIYYHSTCGMETNNFEEYCNELIG